MQSAFLCALTCFVIVSPSLGHYDDIQSQIRTMPHQEECDTPLPSDFWNDSGEKRFKSAEKWAWNERICLGRQADMREASGIIFPGTIAHTAVCNPTEIEKKGGEVPLFREIRPAFLELILSHDPWAAAGRHPQVRISCALIRGDIVLEDDEISPVLTLKEGKIDGQVSLIGSRFRHSFNLQGSTVTGRLNAQGMEAGGNLILDRGGNFADIDLSDAKIAGNVSLSGSTVTGKLNADRLEVGGSLRLNRGDFSDINLRGAKIAGIASVSGSTVTGKLNADRLEVGGSLHLRDCGKFADIDLLGAKIHGTVNSDGSTVAGKLNADRLEVGGSLHLRDGGKFADIDMINAKIGRDVEFWGSCFDGDLDLTGMQIGGELQFYSSQRLNSSAFWLKDAYLNIRNAKADVLQAWTDSWKLSSGGDLPTDLFGFSFNRLGVLDKPDCANMGLTDPQKRCLVDDLNQTGCASMGLTDRQKRCLVEALARSGGASIELTDRQKRCLVEDLDKPDCARKKHTNLQKQCPVEDLDRPDDASMELTDLQKWCLVEELDKSGGTSMGHASADYLVGWIRAQRGYGQDYEPQPYIQLAQVLETAGATEKARTVRFAKFEYKRKHDASLGCVRRILLLFERLFWGHRLYPFRVLIWFCGLVVLGTLLAMWSDNRSVHGLMALWYSLENALPIIETNEGFKNVDHGMRCLNHFFHFQKLAGLVLATVLVGALTLLPG